jgi:hypothetical protein
LLPHFWREKGSPGGWENDDLADLMAIPKDMEHHFATIIVGFDFMFKPFLGCLSYILYIYILYMGECAYTSNFRVQGSSKLMKFEAPPNLTDLWGHKV